MIKLSVVFFSSFLTTAQKKLPVLTEIDFDTKLRVPVAGDGDQNSVSDSVWTRFKSWKSFLRSKPFNELFTIRTKKGITLRLDNSKNSKNSKTDWVRRRSQKQTNDENDDSTMEKKHKKKDWDRFFLSNKNPSQLPWNVELKKQKKKDILANILMTSGELRCSTSAIGVKNDGWREIKGSSELSQDEIMSMKNSEEEDKMSMDKIFFRGRRSTMRKQNQLNLKNSKKFSKKKSLMSLDQGGLLTPLSTNVDDKFYVGAKILTKERVEEILREKAGILSLTLILFSTD